MPLIRIRLVFRQVIDASTARTDFEKAVLTDTYHEFRVQIQTYTADRPFTSWQQLRTAIPQSDPALPIRVGFAIGLYVSGLNGQIPGLTDVLGQPVVFTDYLFSLLDSDTTDPTRHRVALTYLTDTLIWLDTVGNTLLLSLPTGPGTEPATSHRYDTFMLDRHPSLSIVSYEKVPA
ncbi:hypothetical protein [Spirosoma utsteinense]|nr:hypothetical protein [Spirosoma utsteinense]MBC3789089.1 hypothetical protein [Spirosoma utsteinense]